MMVSRHAIVSVFVAAFLATSVLVQDAFSQRRIFRRPMAPIARTPDGAGNNALSTYSTQAEKVLLPAGHKYVKTKSGSVVVYMDNSSSPDTVTLHCACTKGGGGCNVVVASDPESTKTLTYCVASGGCTSCGMVIIATSTSLAALRDAATNKPVKATLVKKSAVNVRPSRTDP